MVRLRQEFVSDPRDLAGMRALLREACRQGWGEGADEEAVGLVELALAEAAANVMLHAYEGRKDQPIELVVEADADRVAVTLQHHGRGFDPGAVPPPSFDGSRESGFGLYLIQECVDRVEYLHEEQGPRGIRLIKARKPPEGRA